jgi:hypothetical protein
VTLTGSGFALSSNVRIDGNSRATTFTNTTTLTVTLLAADVAAIGSHAITVFSPTPGGGTSNSVTLNTVPPPTLTPSAVTVASGGTMSFTLAGGPGNRFDWIGLYCPATNPEGSGTDWRYLNNTKTAPASGLTGATVTFAAPLAGGMTCNARFFINDGFTKLATSATVTVANAVPTLTTLTPGSVSAGSAPSIAVNGTNFVPASVVNVNGAARTTTFVSTAQLTVAILAGDVATAGANPSITVVTPAPGGGTSNSLTLTVAPAPTVTPAAASYPSGNTMTFTVANGPGNVRDWLGLFCPETGADNVYIDWKYLNNTRVAPGAGVTGATITFTAPASSVGGCNARLFADNGSTKLATSSTVIISSTAVSLTAALANAPPTTTASFTVANGPGSPNDWIGWYCPYTEADAAYTDWKYLNGTKTPPATGLTAATVTFTVPAGGGGWCQARLFANNGFTNLANASVSAIEYNWLMLSLSDTALPVPAGTLTAGYYRDASVPATALDWIGLFCPTTTGNMAYVDWKYLNNTTTAPATAPTNATVTLMTSAAVGTKCEARLFSNNGYGIILTTWPATVQP